MPDTYVKPTDIGYIIYPQNPVTFRDDAGAYVDGIAIRFRTPGGNIGIVNVPVAEYTAERAAADVIALGQKLDGL